MAIKKTMERNFLLLNYHAFVATHPLIAVTFSTPTGDSTNYDMSMSIGAIAMLRQQQTSPTRTCHSIINKVPQLRGTMNAEAMTHFLSLPLASRDVASATIAVHTDTLMRGVNRAPLWEKGLKNQTAVHKTSSAAVAKDMAAQSDTALHLVSFRFRVSRRNQIHTRKGELP
jgi:hypothetical protein